MTTFDSYYIWWKICIKSLNEKKGRSNTEKPRIFIMPTYSPMAIPRIVIMTACGATNDDKIVIMVNFYFQCKLTNFRAYHLLVKLATTNKYCYFVRRHLGYWQFLLICCELGIMDAVLPFCHLNPMNAELFPTISCSSRIIDFFSKLQLE